MRCIISDIVGSTLRQTHSTSSAALFRIRARGPGFESRVAPLFHWVATLGKLFTQIAFQVSQLQATGVQKEFPAPKWL